ncbi:hypothetical protein BGZ81_009004 [Podila clonocystis]|nr:hypothetical protein BGZ81_009004 [Podila clonocystis]
MKTFTEKTKPAKRSSPLNPNNTSGGSTPPIDDPQSSSAHDSPSFTLSPATPSATEMNEPQIENMVNARLQEQRGRTPTPHHTHTRDRILMPTAIPKMSSITIGIANSQGIGSSSRSTSSSSLSRLHSLHQTDSMQSSTTNTSRDSSPKPVRRYPSPPTAAAAIPTRRKSSFDNLGSASGTSSAASSFESGRILRRPSDQFNPSYQRNRKLSITMHLILSILPQD